MFKVIIAGSRGFDDYELLKSYAGMKLSKIFESVEIVSGGARGADALGERYAREMGFSLKVFPTEWDKYGKSAGYRRNAQMADYADALIAFWDGESPGTKNMIQLAREKGLRVGVKKFRKG